MSNNLTNPQNYSQILFVDFNGVISYDNFWQEIADSNHPLHQFHNKIENYLFKENPEIISDWMIGKYTSEQIHEILEQNTGVPHKELFEIFEKGCRNLDISIEILQKISRLKQQYYCILSTGNMDSFDRFTIPSNPIITEVFNEIHNSYNLGILKTTNQGQYFSDTIKKLSSTPENCVVIDDSKKVCDTFQNLGGRAICAYGVNQVIKGLNSLFNK